MATECRGTLRTIRQGMHMPGNQHELLVIARDDLPACWLELKVYKGQLSRDDANAIWRYWQDGVWPDDPDQQARLKKAMEIGLGNAASAKSALDAGRLMKDFRGMGRFRTTRYVGREYIVFKDYAGLRSLIRGTRYLADNPLVVAMGIGRLGIKHAAKAGAMVTVVLMGAYRIVEYLLSDKTTLTALIGTLGSDIAKIAAASAVGYGLGSLVVASGMVAGPLVVSIFFGMAAAAALEYVDGQVGVTDKLVAQMEIILREIRGVESWNCRLRVKARDAFHNAVDATAELIVETVRQSGEKAVRRLFGPTYYRGPAHLPGLRR
ncbi:MAG: hypothetical protein WD057_18420 [Aquisalimonadaceae bacterium]